MNFKNEKIIFWLFVAMFFVFTQTSLAQVTIPGNTGLPDPGGDDPIIDVAINLMNWMLAVIGILGVIAFSISGIQYLLSAGNESSIETAKKNMMWSIIGVVVALSGMVIIIFVDNLLNDFL